MHVLALLSANTQQYCPRTACPWHPHMICRRVLSLSRVCVAHAILTRIQAIHTTQHQEHRTENCDVIQNTDLLRLPQARLPWRRQRVTAQRRGDASHMLTTLCKGKVSPIQYRLFSSVWFTLFSKAIMNCASRTISSFFQIRLDHDQLLL